MDEVRGAVQRSEEELAKPVCDVSEEALQSAIRDMSSWVGKAIITGKSTAELIEKQGALMLARHRRQKSHREQLQQRLAAAQELLDQARAAQALHVVQEGGGGDSSGKEHGRQVGRTKARAWRTNSALRAARVAIDLCEVALDAAPEIMSDKETEAQLGGLHGQLSRTQQAAEAAFQLVMQEGTP